MFGAAALVVGCGSKSSYTAGATVNPVTPVAPATISPGDEASLLPLALGNQWTFEVDGTSMRTNGGQQPLSGELTLKISKLEDVPGGKQATMDIYRNGTITSKQIWSVTKDGIFQVATSMKLIPTVPPQPLAHFPVKEGEVVKWTGKGTFDNQSAVPMEATLTAKGARTVDTGMGQMSAFMFESMTTMKTAKIQAATQNTIWLKPGLGIARILQTEVTSVGRGTATLRLKSFTPGKP